MADYDLQLIGRIRRKMLKKLKEDRKNGAWQWGTTTIKQKDENKNHTNNTKRVTKPNSRENQAKN